MLLAVLAVGLTLVPGPATAQVAGLGVGITPAFDSPVTVGEQNQPALIQFVNTSFGPQAAIDPVTLTNIRINTSCATSAVDPTGPSPCPVPEPRPNPAQPVLTLDGTSTAGTTCSGGPFLISGPDAEGDYTITPTTGPVILAPVGSPGSSCFITFTFDVIQRPNDGETFQPVALIATSPTFPGGAPQTGVTRVVVNQATPGLTTVASPNVGVAVPPASVPVGSTVTDQATVSPVANGPVPTGTVTYALFGPNDPACAGPPIAPAGGTQTVIVGSPSPGYVLPAQGLYNFTASYSGDVNYLPIGPVGCGVPAEQVNAVQRTATLQTRASSNGPVAPGATVFDIATLTPTTPGPAPTGTVTYRLVGPLAPGDVTCAAPIVPPVGGASESVPVGNPSPNYVVTQPGTYNFLASFTDPSGVYAPIGLTGCGDPAERFALVAPLPEIMVDKTVVPPSMPEPGGNFTYTVVVSNPGPVPITITSLNDNVYGDLAGLPAATGGARCSTLIGTTLAPGASSPACTFVGAFTGQRGATLTDIVTVVGTDALGQQATDTDDAVVLLTGVPPTVQVVKTPNPTSLPEPGGNFTYTVTVTNTSTVEALRITTLTDDVYGNLATQGTCTTAVGTLLAVSPGPGNTYTCAFTGNFTGVGGQTLTDTVTVTGVDDDGETATDDNDATVTLTSVLPQVRVVKTAAPPTQAAPTGTFTFTATVSNPGTKPIIITSLIDSVYGDLALRPAPAGTTSCASLIGTTVAPGATAPTCTFTGTFTGVAGQSENDTVTVTARDLQNNVVTDQDTATVTLIGAPSILVIKKAQPSALPEPGGTFTFTAQVVNTSPEALTITALTDDVYGDLATRPAPAGTTACSTLIGLRLAPGASSPVCSFTGQFIGVNGQTQTDTITVTGRNDAGTVVTDTDQATVGITPSGVRPTVQVVKTANPPSLPEPGGTFTFTATVTNTGTIPVTITSLVDNPYGNLALRPAPAGTTSCASLIGTTLAPGASSPTCTFTGSFIGDAGSVQTDVVTVVATDATGQTATDDDEATVFITDVAPSITVVKTAAPLSMPAPGGTFTFTVLVTNTSFEPITITSLVDDVYGDINGDGTCAIGATLAPSGGTYTCSFPGDFIGVPNQAQTDIVTVTAVDADGTTVRASDDARVTLTGTPAVLTTQVSAGAVGSSVFDTATLRGGFSPTGTITFQLFNNETCTGTPLFTNVKPVTGTTDPRIIVSDSFILPAPGVYHFVATYSGDANNAQVGPTACLDPNETIGVGRLPISLSTVASPTVGIGGAVFDTATIGGGFGATGTVTFRLYGPDDALCSRTPVFTSVKAVPASGIVVSDSFTPTAAGVYRFVASYSGDANNAPASNACADPMEQVLVTPLPVIQVDKTAIPESLPAPGGDVLFRVAVTNTSNVAITIRSLVDNVYGDITARTASTCNTAIGTVLAPAPGPGNTYTCQFVAPVQGAVGSVHTDVVTVTGTDTRGNTVTDNDDAVVRITGVPPTITTTKVAAPGSLPEPGGTFTFNFSVTNTGPNPVTITALVDDVYGDLNGRGTCAIGARLVSGASYSCSFTGNFRGNAGATQTDTITTTARDDAGQTVTSQSRATVRLTDVPPTIVVTKTPDPISRPEPGGSFRFTVTVTNTGPDPVTITALVDDIYGDLNGRGSCAVGVRLVALGGAYSCAFDGEFRGVAGASQTDTVTATAVDDDNTSVTAIAKATVTLTPVGTPPVSPPPPTPPTPPVVPPLVRTGSDLAGPARLAGLFLLVGMTLIAATRRFGDGGPGLTPVPAGAGPGPRPGGGGNGLLGGGGASWFGRTPRRPLGPPAGLGTGLAQPPAPAKEPAPEATAVVDREPDWDEWVSRRAPAPDGPAAEDEPVAVREAATPEASIPELALPEVALASWEPTPEVVVPEVVVPEVVVPEVVVPEVVVAHVVVPDAVRPHDIVGGRSTSALEGAALDAAQALSGPARAQAPPSGRRRGGKPGRR